MARVRGRSRDTARIRAATLGDGRADRSPGRRRCRSSRWRGGRARTSCSCRSALPTALSLLTSSAHFDRYVLPLVPVCAVLAARTPPLAVATLVAAVVPLWWSVADARSLTGRDPRLDAAAWIERNVPREERVAADSSTLPLREWDVLRLELPGPGRRFDPDRDLARLRGSRDPVARRRRERRGPRPRRRVALPAGGRLLPSGRAAAARVRDARTTPADGHAPGCGSTASTLRRWNGVVGSTGSRSAPPSFCRVPRSSESRSPRAASWPRPSAARSTCGARSSASCSPASRSATGRAARSPTGGLRRTSSWAQSRWAPGSCSRSRSWTNGCWSRSSPGTRVHGSTRSSRR